MDNYYQKYFINKNSMSSYQSDTYKNKYYKYKLKYLQAKQTLKGGSMVGFFSPITSGMIGAKSDI